MVNKQERSIMQLCKTAELRELIEKAIKDTEEQKVCLCMCSGQEYGDVQSTWFTLLTSWEVCFHTHSYFPLPTPLVCEADQLLSSDQNP